MTRVVVCLVCVFGLSLPTFAQAPAGARGRSGALPGGGRMTGGRLSRSFELRSRSRPSPQAGAARLNRLQRPDGLSHRGTRGRPLFSRRSRPATVPTRPAHARHDARAPHEASGEHARPALRQPPLPPTSRRPVAAARALQNRLAAIDRLRDRAIETGDTRLLDHANRMEQDARAHYARMSGSTPAPEPSSSVPEAPAAP